MDIKKDGNMVRVIFEITEDMRRDVKIRAAESGSTMRQVFVSALRSYLKKEDRPEDTTLEDF